MTIRDLTMVSVLLCLLLQAAVYGLEPSELLVITNKNCPDSVSLGQYYCDKRGLPKNNIVKLDLK